LRNLGDVQRFLEQLVDVLLIGCIEPGKGVLHPGFRKFVQDASAFPHLQRSEAMQHKLLAEDLPFRDQVEDVALVEELNLLFSVARAVQIALDFLNKPDAR
jgi:hypothetical protein